MISNRPIRSIALGLAALVGPGAWGTIVAGGDGTQNTAAPPNFAYWNNIGYVPAGSSLWGTGVYLGNDWVLTAGHVQGGNDGGYTFVIPGLNNGQNAVFNPQFASQVFLRHPSGAGSDLALFKLQDDPLLHNLPQVQFGATPAVGTNITVTGAGYNRDATLHYWKLADPAHPETTTWTDVTGTPTQGQAQRQGYFYDASGFARRWGTNTTVAMTGGKPTFTFTLKDASGNVSSVTELAGATFDLGLANESQVAPGDSGGGVWVGNRLVGLNLYKGDFANAKNAALGQPANTAVFGNQSFFADLPTYVDQIASITHMAPSLIGDANLDGVVDTADFKILSANYESGTKWTQGDFNLDGTVDFADFQQLELNFGKVSVFPLVSDTGASAPVFGSVPEPGMVGMLGLAIAAGLVWRRRRIL